jgi:hypothetical protein
VLAVVLVGCVGDLRPMPPRRTQFTQTTPPVQPSPDLAKPAEAPIVHERYGHWVLLADLIAIVPLTYWMARPKDAYLAAPALVLAPAIHIAYGEPDKAAISAALRGLMVAGVYYAGKNLRTECEGELFCYPFGTLLLAELAIIPAVVIDSIFLARSAKPEKNWHRLPMRPTAYPTPGGAALGLLGRF